MEEEIQSVEETQGHCNEGEVMDVSGSCVTLEDGLLEEPAEEIRIEQNVVNKNDHDNIIKNSDNIERRNDIAEISLLCPNKGPVLPGCTLKQQGF